MRDKYNCNSNVSSLPSAWDVYGKYCIVTGASSGIGREIAKGLAERGANVIMVCRDIVYGEEARSYIIRSTGNRNIELLIADLSSQQQIRELVKTYKANHSHLHVLINNAGVIMKNRILTVDGIETTFAVNYLAYFTITNLLLDVLKSSAPSRIINLTSDIHRLVKIDFDNLQGEKSYNRDIAYARSKLAEIIFSYELGRRLEGTGVNVNCVCPGAVASRIWTRSSRLMDTLLKAFMKGPEQGAELPLFLACSNELTDVTCGYFKAGQHFRVIKVKTGKFMARSSKYSYQREIALKLWEISENLTGIRQ